MLCSLRNTSLTSYRRIDSSIGCGRDSDSLCSCTLNGSDSRSARAQGNPPCSSLLIIFTALKKKRNIGLIPGCNFDRERAEATMYSPAGQLSKMGKTAPGLPPDRLHNFPPESPISGPLFKKILTGELPTIPKFKYIFK